MVCQFCKSKEATVHVTEIADNKVKKVEKEVDLDAAAMARLSLQGIATVNQAIAELPQKLH